MPKILTHLSCDHEPKTGKTTKYCRSCYEKDLLKRNPELAERQRENSRQWHAKPENKERFKKYSKAWRAANPPTPEAKQRKWAQRLLKDFGITPEDYQKMLDNQNGGCGVCGKKPTKRRLAVDHDHETGVIRGLLCFRCNYGLGWFSDDLERVHRAIAHLEKSHD